MFPDDRSIFLICTVRILNGRLDDDFRHHVAPPAGADNGKVRIVKFWRARSA